MDDWKKLREKMKEIEANRRACGRAGHDWGFKGSVGLPGKRTAGGYRTGTYQQCRKCGKTRLLVSSRSGRQYVARR